MGLGSLAQCQPVTGQVIYILTQAEGARELGHVVRVDVPKLVVDRVMHCATPVMEVLEVVSYPVES